MDSKYISYGWTLNCDCHNVEIYFLSGMDLGYILQLGLTKDIFSATRGVWGPIFKRKTWDFSI